MHADGPTNITFFPPPNSQTKYKVGDSFIVTSSANPAASYVWNRKKGEGQERIIGNTLNITKDMGGSNTYTVTASNTANGMPNSINDDITFEVEVHSCKL